MKRCPECEFLYEDEQERCDMDGTSLRSTGFLPPLPLPQHVIKPSSKPIWSGLTIPLLVLVIVGSVLVVLYRATPPTFSSSIEVKHKPAKKDGTKAPASDATPQLEPAPASQPPPAQSPTVQSGSSQTTAENRVVQSMPARSATGDLEIHFQVDSTSAVVSSPKPAMRQAPPARTIPKTTATSYSPSDRREPTARTSPAPVVKSQAQPQPKPQTKPEAKPQAQNEDSPFKSIFKKAGRILKKPF